MSSLPSATEVRERILETVNQFKTRAGQPRRCESRPRCTSTGHVAPIISGEWW